MSKKCASCGSRLIRGGDHCPECGARVRRRQRSGRKKTKLYGESDAKPRRKATAIAGTPRELADGDSPPDHPDIRATRSARLPPEPPRDSQPKEPLSWRSKDGGSAREVGTSKPGPNARRKSSPSDVGRPTRPTLIDRISRLSIDVAGRTTIIELASIAENIRGETRSRIPPRFGFGVVIAGSLLATLVLVVTAALAIGVWRWIPVVFLFLSTTALVGWGALRSLPRLARRFGNRVIPGRAAAWLTLGFAVVAGVSWTITLSVSAAADQVGQVVWPTLAPHMPDRLVALEKKAPPPPKKVKKKPSKPRQIWVEPGILFKPRTFHVEEGGFDLIVFFHGNPDIVKEAVPRAGLNALVHVTNLGVGSAPYQTRYIVPDSLLALIALIEDQSPKLGLPPGLKARRVALASWSAGYGALHSILLDADHIARVDAVLVLDGIHGGFLPNIERAVHPTTIAPFLNFANLAVDEKKLMMITHSAIPTAEFTSSTEAADALLKALSIQRAPLDDDPPKVKFKAALRAFPASKRRWLRARTEGRKGDFIIRGYAGNTKEDHIAHLAQMSVTVLEALHGRWKAAPAPRAPESAPSVATP